MRIVNEVDYARDIAVYGGFITVEAGASVDLAEHLPADVAATLGARLCEQDGWSDADPPTKSKTAVAKSSSGDTPVKEGTD